MSTRKETIQRIRKALGRPADGSSMMTKSTPPASPLVGILPTILPDELLPRFESELRKVAGIAYRAANRQELEHILESILSQSKANSVVLSRNPILRELNLEPLLRAWGEGITVWPSLGTPVTPDSSLEVFAEASFAVTVGITGVEFALAETGSLVVTSWTEGTQLASLAPPVHIALYRRSQLVASLEEVLERLPVAGPHPSVPSPVGEGNKGREDGQGPGRSVVFITGTSRTADIEQVLIRGVHGPGAVHAILVEEACFL